jgi:hypothetical protein
MMVIGWIAKCSGCLIEGPYTPLKSGKPPVNHIVDGRMCGAFVPQPKAPLAAMTTTQPQQDRPSVAQSTGVPHSSQWVPISATEGSSVLGSISEETAPSETLTAGDEFIDITAPNTVV